MDMKGADISAPAIPVLIPTINSRLSVLKFGIQFGAEKSVGILFFRKTTLTTAAMIRRNIGRRIPIKLFISLVFLKISRLLVLINNIIQKATTTKIVIKSLLLARLGFMA